MSTALFWDKVTKSVGREKLTIFNRASLVIRDSEFVGVVGPSGVGKTTMIMLSAGILQPDFGRIFVGDVRIDNLDRRRSALVRRRHIGIVFQFFNLIPTLTVIENVALPLILNGYAWRKAEKVAMDYLRYVGLEDKANVFPQVLSGGEQQRVAVVRAIIHKPRIVLADEPTGNLDEENKERVFRLFKEFNMREGITILVATHDVDLASRYVDRIVRIKDKRFIEVK